MKNLILITLLILHSSKDILANERILGVFTGDFRCADNPTDWEIAMYPTNEGAWEIKLKSFHTEGNKRYLSGDWTLIERSGYNKQNLFEVTETTLESPNIPKIKNLQVAYQKNKGSEKLICILNNNDCRGIELHKSSKKSKELKSLVSQRSKAYKTLMKENPLIANIGYFKGNWSGFYGSFDPNYYRHPKYYYLTLSENKSMLRVIDNKNVQFATLIPESGSTGEVIFQVKSNENLGFQRVKLLVRATNYPHSVDYTLQVSEKENTFSPGIKLFKPEKNNEYLQKIFTSASSPSVFVYSDWRDKVSTQTKTDVTITERLKHTFERLNHEENLSCLEKKELVVSSSSLTTYELNHSHMKYLIYSPNKNSGLEYSITTKVHGYRILEAPYYYPIIAGLGSRNSTTSLHFSLQPNFSDMTNPARTTPVTVYILGKTPQGKTPTSCLN
jgi:hypothetical protein